VGRDELWIPRAQNDHRIAKVRLGGLASKQFGCVTWTQLCALGISPATIRRWVSNGYLLVIFPRVYAVGHVAEDLGTRLFSLALFAGPDAALSHGTAAHWRGWLRFPVPSLHVSTPRRIYTRLPGATVHGRRDIERERVNGIPCTTVTQTLLDVAATESPRLVHRCLAQLDYERKLNAKAIRKACGRGKPGSAAMIAALRGYIPEMARTKSELEDNFLYLCQRFDVPIPKVNTTLHGEEPDCYWPEFGLVVELDGDSNHGTPAQRRRDRRKDMKLRGHGLAVLRYDSDQVTHDAATVAADVLAQIEQRTRTLAA
jgi:hypothetical protein